MTFASPDPTLPLRSTVGVSVVGPETSAATYELLCNTNGPAFYERHVIPDYAHLDCFIGKRAWREVWPTLLAALEKGNVPR